MATFRFLVLFSYSAVCAANSSYYVPRPGEVFSYKDISPEIWDATEQNKKTDPMREILAEMRANREKALNDPDAPQMFTGKNLIQSEFVSSRQPWQELEDVFNLNWSAVKADSSEELQQLRGALKVKTVLDHPDIKAIEVALAPLALLPNHADPAPGVYHIVEGAGEITVNGETILAHTGTSIKLESFSERRIRTTSETPLKLIWFRWAPGGQQQYLDYGYYLTGSNFHAQPLESVMPKNFQQWQASSRTPYKELDATTVHKFGKGFYPEQNIRYPATPQFSNEIDVPWLDFENIPKEGFFWAKDASKAGAALKAWNKMVRMKGVFQAKVPNRQFDFNISYIAAGPKGKYITHSHATPEFYYILGGETEWTINNKRYVATAGNMYFHNPYADHEMRGMNEGEPEIAITGSWAPFGDRTVFETPMLLTEPLELQPSTPTISDEFNFHDFKIMKNLKFQKKQCESCRSTFIPGNREQYPDC